MKNRTAQYSGYTLAEILVVLIIVIILGAVGAYAYSGLRDTVIVKQDVEEIKQNLQLIKQKSMLLEKKDGESWIYGFGIDFGELTEGKYTFFKWCSPFAEYGNPMTRNEIMAYTEDYDIGRLLPDNLGTNGYLAINYETGFSMCEDDEAIGPYLLKLPGLEDGEINAGFNITGYGAQYVVFEAVTGRAFLYDEYGAPINYLSATYDPTNKFYISVLRNRGEIADILTIAPLSGAITHEVVEGKTAIAARLAELQ